jgi:hypothetical protein
MVYVPPVVSSIGGKVALWVCYTLGAALFRLLVAAYQLVHHLSSQTASDGFIGDNSPTTHNIYQSSDLCKMATKRPRTTVSFDPSDYEELQQWADEEFRSVPQLIHVIIKKALIERKQQSPSPSNDSKKAQ